MKERSKESKEIYKSQRRKKKKGRAQVVSGIGSKALYLRSIAFIAIVLLLMRVYCCSCVLRGLWRVVRGSLLFCRVASLSDMPSRLIFSPLLAFWVCVGVFIWANAVNALVSRF